MERMKAHDMGRLVLRAHGIAAAFAWFACGRDEEVWVPWPVLADLHAALNAAPENYKAAA